jgi:hypothetical protein
MRSEKDVAVEVARFERIKKAQRKPFNTRFDIAAAMARNRMRRLGLSSHYGFDIYCVMI